MVVEQTTKDFSDSCNVCGSDSGDSCHNEISNSMSVSLVAVMFMVVAVVVNVVILLPWQCL